MSPLAKGHPALTVFPETFPVVSRCRWRPHWNKEQHPSWDHFCPSFRLVLKHWWHCVTVNVFYTQSNQLGTCSSHKNKRLGVSMPYTQKEVVFGVLQTMIPHGLRVLPDPGPISENENCCFLHVDVKIVCFFCAFDILLCNRLHFLFIARHIDWSGWERYWRIYLVRFCVLVLCKCWCKGYKMMNVLKCYGYKWLMKGGTRVC